MSLNSPGACRNGHPCETVGLKEVLVCGASHGPEGSLIEKIASALDIRPRTLHDQLNVNEPDWLQSKNLDAFAVFTKSHPVIARHFSALQDGFFYQVRPGAVTDQLTAKSVLEFGEFLQEVAKGPMTPERLARLRKEGTDAMASIQAVIASAEQLATAVTK